MSSLLARAPSSSEGAKFVTPGNHQFGRTVYESTANQAFGYSDVDPVTEQTQFGTTLTWTPYREEGVLSALKWRVVLNPLTASGGTAGHLGRFLRWRRHAAYNGIESIRYVFGSEPLETYPGYWPYLQNRCFNEEHRGRQIDEVFDFPEADRESLSAGEVTMTVDLRPSFTRHRGLYLPLYALRQLFRVEIKTRSAEHWYEHNHSSATTINASMKKNQLFIETTYLSPAETASYVKSPWRVPMKEIGTVQEETVSVPAGGTHTHLINEPGFIEAYMFNLRSTATAAANEHVYGDRLDGQVKVSFRINNTDIWTQRPIEEFLDHAQRRYISVAPGRGDQNSWHLVPFALDPGLVAGTGGVDHNVPNRIELVFHFTNAFSGDLSVIYLKKNEAVLRSGAYMKVAC